MSHHNRRRHPKDDYDRRDYYETPEQKLRKDIIHYGEVDPIQELPRLANQIFEHIPANVPIVTEGFRIGVTEQPFKIPYYAALLRLLHDRPAADGAPSSFGGQVLEDFWKGFQAFLDKGAWREIRLCVHFFAHATVAGVVSVPSMFELLRSFKGVLEEVVPSYTRTSSAILCVAEGLLIAGAVIKRDPSLDVSEIIGTLNTHIESDFVNSNAKVLAEPLVRLHSSEPVMDHAEEWLACALAVLQDLEEKNFTQAADSMPQPYLEFPAFEDTPFELPKFLVTPEEVELDSTESGKEGQVKKGEWPRCYVRLFDDDITPDPKTPAGFILRSNLIDMISIFEVNRKDCARLLLELPKWTLPGTFKPRSGAPAPAIERNLWELDNTLIETILSTMFLLPDSPHKSIYYISLITELCKSSPQTVGPAVGKSIRRLYALLSDGLDVEISHRFAEWFAVHMSNFGFVWVWKEWIPDLSLVARHPKRAFMRRAVEFEIRLSYYDRILRTLPETMAEPDAQVMPDQAPGPEFEFEEPENPHLEPAQSILNLLRGRAKPEDVIAHLETLRNSLSETVEGDVNVDSLLRSITVQSLLSIGSRSFSHFLNAIERYLPLLRNLAAGQISSTGTPHLEARTDIMNAIARVWRRSRHMILIVFDKLMQYQIVDPTDVVMWTFAHCAEVVEGRRKTTFNAFQWDVLKSALDKANGRVMVQTKKVAALRREADDKAARAIAGDTAAMEVDGEGKHDMAPAGETPQLTAAIKASNVLTREQGTAFERAQEGFVKCLAVQDVDPKVLEVLSMHAWHNRANWEDDSWDAWETWGWYRHWVRVYAHYMKPIQESLSAVSGAKAASPPHEATALFKTIWNSAMDMD